MESIALALHHHPLACVSIFICRLYNYQAETSSAVQALYVCISVRAELLHHLIELTGIGTHRAVTTV